VRATPNLKAEKFRVHDGESGQCVGQNVGAFMVFRNGVELCIIVSDEGGWDHISVHVQGRCPTWSEMCCIKELFFKDDEVVMQLHPAKNDHVNCHPYTLHMWRPQTKEERAAIVDRYGLPDEVPDVDYPPIPLPPKVMV
jgi:hypothetical protein